MTFYHSFNFHLQVTNKSVGSLCVLFLIECSATTTCLLSPLFLHTFLMHGKHFDCQSASLLCLYAESDIVRPWEILWFSFFSFLKLLIKPFPRLRFPNFLDSSDTLSMEGYFVVLSGMIFHLRWVIPVSRILFLKNILCILFAHSFQQPLLWFLAVRLYVIYLDRHWHILLCLSLHVHLWTF